MEETESKLVRDSFSAVMAYLVYPQELRGSIESILGARNLEEFMGALKQRIAAETDATRKTDCQIFLNELRRRLQQSVNLSPKREK